MNNQYTSITNQKISVAKKHLACLMALDRKASKLLVTAYQDSIVFQLHLACDSFAQEIAIDFQVNVAKQIGFTELEKLLAEKAVPCSHCSQLSSLLSGENNWLSWLQKRYSQCWEERDYLAPYKAIDTDLFAGQSLISLTDINEQSDEQWLKQCINELSEVVREYRELMQQW